MAVRRLLIYILLGRGGVEMMAMLWAQQIMLGKKKFADVPKLLKDKTREILIDSGCEDLIVEG